MINMEVDAKELDSLLKKELNGEIIDIYEEGRIEKHYLTEKVLDVVKKFTGEEMLDLGVRYFGSDDHLEIREPRYRVLVKNNREKTLEIEKVIKVKEIPLISKGSAGSAHLGIPEERHGSEHGEVREIPVGTLIIRLKKN